MADLCVSLSKVKPGLLPASKALDKNDDGQACKSENQNISDKEFEDFISLVTASKPRPLVVIRPEMVTSDKLSFNVMKAPVTVAMFRQFVEAEANKPDGYKIVGHNAEELTALLTNSKRSDQALTYVSYKDAEAFVAWRREKTGEAKTIPTETQWENASRVVGNKLTGSLWEWAQTNSGETSKVLRSLPDGLRSSLYSGIRYFNGTLRLVEDKKQ